MTSPKSNSYCPMSYYDIEANLLVFIVFVVWIVRVSLHIGVLALVLELPSEIERLREQHPRYADKGSEDKDPLDVFLQEK